MNYQLEDLIDLVSDLVGLKAISKATVADMAIELQEVQNQSEYIKFIKSHINVVGMEYLQAYQRFIKLTEQYKRKEQEELNRSRIEQMGTLAEKLAQKVKLFDTMVINHPHKSFLKWEHIKSVDDSNVNYFGDKEIKALVTIGQPLHCIELQRSISGRDCLCERLEAIFIDKVVNPTALEFKGREIHNMSAQTHNLISDLTKAKRN